VRPNIVKPKPAPALQNQDDSEEEQTNVPETQAQSSTAVDEFGSDFDESEYASDASHTPKRRKVPPKTEEPKAVKEGVIKKAAKKIAATANANYRRLNIKGKAGTAGKAKGKFGRRR
jgi:hypothetical protein